PEVTLKLFEEYLDLGNSNIDFLITFEGIAFISKPPIFTGWDNKNRMHCINDYAVYYKDGYGQHYIHGVYFEPKLFDKFFKTKNYTSKEIMILNNTEQKTALIQELGFNSIMGEIKNKKFLDKSLKYWNNDKNKPVEYELFEFELSSNLIQRCLKVEWWEKGIKRQTVLGIPREKQTETCEGARAWTYGEKILELAFEA
ncbi:MAG: hypothetical protein AABY22_06935, partial [Nanoarchaeota archaeon]